MPNKLAQENSPYLLQHAENPVNWYPWGTEALSKAHSEDKPIFLSIGYAACHWCHVMAHESFEDANIADIMNEHFINIKVDREERPDLDGIYMQAVVAMTGQGGWPMSVFLTPDGLPFYGGTYFPPARSYNLPSFREILLTIARLWKEDRSQLLENSQKISAYIKQATSQDEKITPISAEKLDQAVMVLAQTYDWKNGGWGKAPKFPQPLAIDFLLQRATRGDSLARDMAVHALKKMSTGGMYDVVGGGFARYSTDDIWLIPHFEKMLYDNAQLAIAYLHGWLISGDVHLRQICEATLDFITRELTHPMGGFFSSLDADSEGKEGKFYVWAAEELRVSINDPQLVEIFNAAYNITSSGNFEGEHVLQRALDDKQLGERFNLPESVITEKLIELHDKLLNSRATRIRPATDDKIIVSWNALACSAFAEAGRYLKRADYLSVAQRNANFLLENLIQNERLLRSWRSGQSKHNAYLEDHAALIFALLSLYQSDDNLKWYDAAKKLANVMIDHFSDPDGGLFDTRDDHEELIIRPKDKQDNVTPSGNSLAASALLRLAAYEGNATWRKLAEQMIESVQEVMPRYPTSFSHWLQAADFAIGPVNEVAIIGEGNHPTTLQFKNTVWEKFHPRLVVAVSDFPPDPLSPALLHNRSMLNNLPTVYVCQGFVCLQPTNNVEDLSGLLEQDKSM
jgi:uncharacterized protein YyaL (SSP411 family)